MGEHLKKLITTEYASKAVVFAEATRGASLAPLLDADVVIDFSSADAVSTLAQAALASGRAGLPCFVIGSTGWQNDGQIELIETLAKKTPVLMSSNFSIGVLILQKILKQFAPALLKAGYSPTMTETHHQHKKDAPSGTAIFLNRAIQEVTGSSSVPTRSVRTGEVIGDHEIVFQGKADRLLLLHSAQDRSIFARGALDAALWLHERRSVLPRKLLTMEDYHV
jgi:4-hydroxy-tetrahydrodipicolinate reductase